MNVIEKIQLNKTEKGGWTKAFLASIGVAWPPPKGWKKEIERRENERNQSQ